MQHFTLRTAATLHMIQGVNTILDQQQDAFDDLVAPISEDVGDVRPPSPDEIQNLDAPTYVYSSFFVVHLSAVH